MRPRGIVAVGVIAVIVIVLFRVPLAWSLWDLTHHDAVILLAPRHAGLLFEVGSFHLNARSGDYDLERAEDYLNRAALLDADLAYVHHELARVYFLKGDMEKALAHSTTQISLYGEHTPNAFYIRGLIEGFMGRYAEAAVDYENYLAYDGRNWAALTDYAWVLLKDNRPREAAAAAARGLAFFPDNPWLLSVSSIALYEMGAVDAARDHARAALEESHDLTADDWSLAYPGNDPLIAPSGLLSFQEAIRSNLKTIVDEGHQ